MVKLKMVSIVERFIKDVAKGDIDNLNSDGWNQFLIQGMASFDDVFEHAAFYHAVKMYDIDKKIDLNNADKGFADFVKKIDRLSSEIMKCELEHSKFLEPLLAEQSLHEKSEDVEVRDESAEDAYNILEEKSLLTNEQKFELFVLMESALRKLYGDMFEGNTVEQLNYLMNVKKMEDEESYNEDIEFLNNYIKENNVSGVGDLVRFSENGLDVLCRI